MPHKGLFSIQNERKLRKHAKNHLDCQILSILVLILIKYSEKYLDIIKTICIALLINNMTRYKVFVAFLPPPPPDLNLQHLNPFALTIDISFNRLLKCAYHHSFCECQFCQRPLQKYWQLKLAHLFTLPACLVSPLPCLCRLLAFLFCCSSFL